MRSICSCTLHFFGVPGMVHLTRKAWRAIVDERGRYLTLTEVPCQSALKRSRLPETRFRVGSRSSPRPCTRGRGVGGEGANSEEGKAPLTPTPLPRVQGRGA